MKELVGKKVVSVEIDKDEQHYVRFVTDAGSVCYFAEGDCCSESWFYHILGVDNIIGHIVTQSEEVDLPDPPDDGKSRQEVDVIYGVKITTQKGYTDIEFRNSSNGYYGGELIKVEMIPPEVNMVLVTEDYTD